jgi:hypothetical protein
MSFGIEFDGGPEALQAASRISPPHPIVLYPVALAIEASATPKVSSRRIATAICA